MIPALNPGLTRGACHVQRKETGMKKYWPLRSACRLQVGSSQTHYCRLQVGSTLPGELLWLNPRLFNPTPPPRRTGSAGASSS